MGAVDLPDILQPYLAAVLEAKGDLGDLLYSLKFVQGADDIFGLSFFQLATGQVDILLGQALADLLDVQVHQADLLLVEIDPDLLFEATLHLHRRHPGHRFQGALDLLLRHVAVEEQVAASGQPQANDRIQRGVVFQNQGFFGVFREEDRIEPLPHLADCLVHVAVPVEFQDHIRLPGFGDRTDRYQVADHTQRFFDGAGDGSFHLFRSGAGKFGAHGEGGIGNVRHQVEG